MMRPLVDLEAPVYSISKAQGVYALVLRLDRQQEITFNRRGAKHTFAPGWYVYAGSAFGPGGIDGRVARHQRRAESGKRMHWNVDYFREFAGLYEVWYHEAESSETEHRWAEAIGAMAGAAVPIPKFGAHDCSARCPAHFFQFSDRPWTMVFRDRLQSLGVEQAVSVEFFNEDRSQFSACAPNVAEHQLGRRFLERRRRAMAESKLGKDKWRSMAKGRPSRILAEEVAEQRGVSFKEIDNAVKFAAAVETIVRNCGETAVKVLFDAKRPQRREKILEISRDSDVRQRYRVDGVISGRFRSVGRSREDTVFDTVTFAEVLSRLARGRGSLQKFQSGLRKSTSQGVKLESQKVTRLCVEAATVLEELVNSPKPLSVKVPAGLTKAEIMPVLREKRVQGELIGEGRRALRLTVKNVWDYHEMWRRGIRTTNKQREQSCRELLLIATRAQ